VKKLYKLKSLALTLIPEPLHRTFKGFFVVCDGGMHGLNATRVFAAWEVQGDFDAE
jgi:hypothetical protein